MGDFSIQMAAKEGTPMWVCDFYYGDYRKDVNSLCAPINTPGRFFFQLYVKGRNNVYIAIVGLIFIEHLSNGGHVYHINIFADMGVHVF